MSVTYIPSGGGSGSNASVGATGTTAPTSATEIGIIVGGNLVGVSSSNPIPVSASLAAASGAVTETTPTVTTATSVTILALNAARKYAFVQNNTAANIMISLSGNVLTGIVPSATNIGLVLTPGAYFESSPGYTPTGAITVYQTSGGTVNTIYVASA